MTHSRKHNHIIHIHSWFYSSIYVWDNAFQVIAQWCGSLLLLCLFWERRNGLKKRIISIRTVWALFQIVFIFLQLDGVCQFKQLSWVFAPSFIFIFDYKRARRNLLESKNKCNTFLIEGYSRSWLFFGQITIVCWHTFLVWWCLGPISR